ncbi:uncharacterized protein At5g39865-like [Primulina eburnea]|uniref:uncharacterized protein At5g39865-like n=1 Tax=Primulina eburnea TaxID=1245227 RepID=UPI003C6C9DAF
MGCSASRSCNFISQQQNPTSNSSSSRSNSQFQSPCYSFSDPSTTPVSRTVSIVTPLIHHPPSRKGDSHHFVSLTSTTYGYLGLMEPQNTGFSGQDFAKSTAQMKKIRDLGESEDSFSPDSVVNTWELMEGLDDDEFNFQIMGSHKREMDASEMVKSYDFVENEESKPLWKHLSEESLLAKLDFNVVSSYRKALLTKRHGYERFKNVSSRSQKIESLESNDSCCLVSVVDDFCHLVGADDRIVLYYTSLRGIRKTYEDCCSVRVILRSFRVCVDERDISMDQSYRKELQGALNGKTPSLPQVFIKGKHIGGVEEIKLLNETGKLANLLEGFPLMDLGFVCKNCGDARFLPCPNCNGSRKVYEEEGKLRKCPDCNENGLVRCSGCCR